MASDFERFNKIWPVFRAGNSSTHRHLIEFASLELEMAIEEHRHEALELINETMNSILKIIYESFGAQSRMIKQHFLCKDLVWLK